VEFYVLCLQISVIVTLIGGINLLVTIINMRAPGITYMRMPMLTWATVVTSSFRFFALPPFTVGLGLLMLDRLFETSFSSLAL
ncbi:cbb3-type cytochrome c oxidase subunit I, partial [Bacillus paranthracis]|uniref:cbb3-type cytochrome c oxidase subunit I n=1 Tax=Bacillus paranthracis TaxID=2026186 RepID=UPI00284A7B30